MTLSNTCQIINNNAIENTMQFLDKDIIIIYYYHQYYFMNKKHYHYYYYYYYLLITLKALRE